MHLNSDFPRHQPPPATLAGWWTAAEDRAFAVLPQEEADHLAWELNERTDLHGVPALVQDFLFGPWVHVLAHARLRALDAQREKRYWDAVDDLIWSVNPDVTLRRPGELLVRVSPLIATLREGLSLLAPSVDHDHQAFFDGLMKLHRPALKVRRAKARRDSQSAHDFVDTVPSGPVPLPKAASLIDELCVGDSAYLYAQGRWLKVRLEWVSANRQLLLFRSPGGASHSMTRRSCERLARNNELIPIAGMSRS